MVPLITTISYLFCQGTYPSRYHIVVYNFERWQQIPTVTLFRGVGCEKIQTRARLSLNEGISLLFHASATSIARYVQPPSNLFLRNTKEKTFSPTTMARTKLTRPRALGQRGPTLSAASQRKPSAPQRRRRMRPGACDQTGSQGMK